MSFYHFYLFPFACPFYYFLNVFSSFIIYYFSSILGIGYLHTHFGQLKTVWFSKGLAPWRTTVQCIIPSVRATVQSPLLPRIRVLNRTLIAQQEAANTILVSSADRAYRKALVPHLTLPLMEKVFQPKKQQGTQSLLTLFLILGCLFSPNWNRREAILGLSRLNYLSTEAHYAPFLLLLTGFVISPINEKLLF